MASRGDWDEERERESESEGGEVEREGSTGGVSRRADVPDSVNVLYGVADLLAELFLIKLHLHKTQTQQGGLGSVKISIFLYLLSFFYLTFFCVCVKKKF